MNKYSVAVFAWCDRLQHVYIVETNHPDEAIQDLMNRYPDEWHEARIHQILDNRGNARFYKTIKKAR